MCRNGGWPGLVKGFRRVKESLINIVQLWDTNLYFSSNQNDVGTELVKCNDCILTILV